MQPKDNFTFACALCW